jgi:hypothetical protein
MDEDKCYLYTFFIFASQPLYFLRKGSPEPLEYKARMAAEPISIIWGKNTNFFLWGYLKSKVYSTRPTDLHALKNILEEIATLSEETLQDVMRRFLTRVHLCIEEDGGHLEDIVHR